MMRSAQPVDFSGPEIFEDVADCCSVVFRIFTESKTRNPTKAAARAKDLVQEGRVIEAS